MRSGRQILLCFAFLLLLFFSCAGAGESLDDAAPLIRVCLKRLALTDRIDILPTGSYTLDGDGFSLTLRSGAEYILQLREGLIYLYDGSFHMRCGSSVQLIRHDNDSACGLRFTKSGNLYPGDLSVSDAGGILQPVLELSVEEYLRGVLPYEMSNDFPLEALKAQAVCARSYALSKVNPSAAYDVVDTTNDQVYRGTGNHPRCDQAVLETAGIVGTYKGQLVTCYYSASNGGQTETIGHVWSGVEDNGLYQMVDDPYDFANPESIVKRVTLMKSADHLPTAFLSILQDAMRSRMEKQGFDTDPSSFRIDSLDAVILSGAREPSRFYTKISFTFTWSGRRPRSAATPSLADGTYGEDEDVLFFVTSTPAPALSLLGPFETGGSQTLTLDLFPDVLKSLNLSVYGANNELVTLLEKADSFVLESRRFGHGLGLSQRGAQWMAGHEKWTYDQILAFYYPGMTLEVLGSSAPEVPTLEPALAMTPGPSASPTPRPTLMPVATGDIPEGAYLASVEGIDDDSSLNLRAEPSQAAEILMRLYKHQKLLVLETAENPAWVKVRTDSAEGYVMVSFLERMDDPQD